jgi:altronate hydrolase
MNILRIHTTDNVAVALQSLQAGTTIELPGFRLQLLEDIPEKHKFTLSSLPTGADVIMYGNIVGKTSKAILVGSLLSTQNVKHHITQYNNRKEHISWEPPDTSNWKQRHFSGYYRKDGKVGTRNYWLVIPLVFCENRNIEVLEKLFEDALGFTPSRKPYGLQPLIDAYQKGASASEIIDTELQLISEREDQRMKIFPNLDGIRFLKHNGGCGGTREDAEVLCRLLAGYITNANVAGATVLSLGCQNAQTPILQKAIHAIDPGFSKPIYYLEQQDHSSEHSFIELATKQTFLGCMEANKITRRSAPLSRLILGLECGGSDGFSGISANPTLGQASDLLVALGAAVILAEFPELHGVEQELINRCSSDQLAQRFTQLMNTYAQRAKDVGSDFAWNPSPGNIRDGLITDAMKSAGAAKKGGTSPITDILDYSEPVKKKGLNLLCTPGNDVESTTALAGSGATLIAFTTGLGTPTGNPIAPTVKISSNSELAAKMRDIIDFDTGEIIRNRKSIEELGASLLDLIISTASGEYLTKAELLGQFDFIPWKRGISL